MIRGALRAQAGNPALLGCAQARAHRPPIAPSPRRRWTAEEDRPAIAGSPDRRIAGSPDRRVAGSL